MTRKIKIISESLTSWTVPKLYFVCVFTSENFHYINAVQ